MTRDKQIEKITEFFDVRKNTMINKGADYATETDVLSNFKYSGNIIGLSKEMQILSLIATKVARLGNLLNNGNTPNNESIDDSILDLGCYTDLLYCARKEDEDKNNSLLDKFTEAGIKAAERFRMPLTPSPHAEKWMKLDNSIKTLDEYPFKVGDEFRYKKEELQYELYNMDDKDYYFQSKAIKRQVSKEEFNNSPDWIKL